MIIDQYYQQQNNSSFWNYKRYMGVGGEAFLDRLSWPSITG